MRITREKKRVASKKRGGVVRNTTDQNAERPASKKREQTSNILRPRQTEASAADCGRKQAGGTVVRPRPKIARRQIGMFRQRKRRQFVPGKTGGVRGLCHGQAGIAAV